MSLQDQCRYSGKMSLQVIHSTQPLDSRQVLTPSQHNLSRQIMRNWEVWKTNIEKSSNHRILQQLALHTQQTIQDTSVQDLDPRPCADNVHESVLPHEMAAIEPGENPTRTLTWKSLAFLSHIKCRTNDDRFPLPLWETWF